MKKILTLFLATAFTAGISGSAYGSASHWKDLQALPFAENYPGKETADRLYDEMRHRAGRRLPESPPPEVDTAEARAARRAWARLIKKICEEVDGSNRFLRSERWEKKEPLEEYMGPEQYRVLLGSVEAPGELESSQVAGCSSCSRNDVEMKKPKRNAN